MAISTYISIITLNVNEPNAPVKDLEWPNGKKQDPNIVLPTRLSL